MNIGLFDKDETTRVVWTNGESALNAYKREALLAAKELGYSAKTRTRIKNAKTCGDIRHIMHDARNKELG